MKRRGQFRTSQVVSRLLQQTFTTLRQIKSEMSHSGRTFFKQEFSDGLWDLGLRVGKREKSGLRGCVYDWCADHVCGVL